MRPRPSRLSNLAAALCLVLACAAHADPACPTAAEIGAPQLLGFWRAEVEGQPGATLLFEQHPVYTESFSGAINRNGDKARVAGDIEDGEFTLEESLDGVHIAATWLGDVVDTSCGKEIRGTRQAEGDARVRRFILRKMEQTSHP